MTSINQFTPQTQPAIQQTHPTTQVFYVLVTHIDKAYPHSSSSSCILVSTFKKAKEIAMNTIEESVPDYYVDKKPLPPFNDLFSHNPAYNKNTYWYSDNSIDWYNKIEISKKNLNLNQDVIIDI